MKIDPHAWRLPVAARLAPCLPILALAPQLGAQAIAGSDTHTAIAQAIANAGGRATMLDETLESTVGQQATGDRASDGTFTLESSVAWASPFLGALEPIVHGVAEETGIAMGGETVTVYGLNFTAPGAGAADVRFAGKLGAGVTVVDNTTITVITPRGRDALDNPFAAVDVEVENALGSDSAAEAFVYLPALEAFSQAQLGKPYTITILAEPMSPYLFHFGGATPTPPMVLPGFVGTIALSTDAILHQTGIATTGEDDIVFQVPGDPALANAVIEFQAAVLNGSPPPLGEMTNVLSTVLYP